MRYILLTVLTLSMGILNPAFGAADENVSIKPSGDNLSVAYAAVQDTCQGNPSLIVTDHIYKAHRVGNLSGLISLNFGDPISGKACHVLYETNAKGTTILYKGQLRFGRYQLVVNGVLQGVIIVPVSGTMVFERKS